MGRAGHLVSKRRRCFLEARLPIYPQPEGHAQEVNLLMPTSVPTAALCATCASLPGAASGWDGPEPPGPNKDMAVGTLPRGLSAPPAAWCLQQGGESLGQAFGDERPVGHLCTHEAFGNEAPPCSLLNQDKMCQMWGYRLKGAPGAHGVQSKGSSCFCGCYHHHLFPFKGKQMMLCFVVCPAHSPHRGPGLFYLKP